MFNRDFYPTPTELIPAILGSIEITGKTFLEPQAGKGNIVEYLKANGGNVLACEKNNDLAVIVKSKCRFLKHDFFEVTAEEISHVNYIVMNPPFSNEEEHLLHAWNIAPDGCHIISLCNYEMYKNDYTRKRNELKRKINDYGNIVNLGDVFTTAERTTEVEIGLVNLYKPGSATNFDGYFDYTPDEEEKQYNGLMPYNAVREAVNRYVEACKLYDKVAATAVQMNDIAGPFGLDKLTLALKEGDKEQSIQRFRIDLQKQAWWWVFGKMSMEKYTTGKLKEELNKFVETQTKVPFTMRNVYKMLQVVVGTHGDRMTKELVRVFDELTARHKENRQNIEGWKSNSHYMINKKFIIDWGTETWSSPRLTQYSYQRLEDLTKALCFITGKNFDDVNLPSNNGEIYSEGKTSGTRFVWGEWHDFGFLTVKLYKKGTVHAKFCDLKVWEQFNRAVAKAKGYQLPEKLL